MADTNTKKKKKKTQKIEESTTTSTSLPSTSTTLNATGSSSTSNLLSAEYSPNHNPTKKDELVQSASIKILEVESLLDKINIHINKHHRKSSQKLQDFEQIHTELSKIQSSLIHDEQSANNPNKRIKSDIDTFIIISSTDHNDDDDDDKYAEEKDDEKHNPIETVHSTLSQLEPFQSLVSKIQNEIDPNNTSSHSDFDEEHNVSLPRKNSIKVKKSELHTIHDYVNQHRNEMKEKTFQYEEKKKQLLSAKERLNKAKARFRKRLNKAKSKTHRSRTRSEHTKVRNLRYNKHIVSTKAATTSNVSSPVVHVIQENGDDTVLSLANLSKLDASERSSDKQQKHNKSSMSPRNKYSNLTRLNHNKTHTNSSVQSAFSVISDQSFVEDFHSITAELESIDDIVRMQVKSPSMTSIFSDLATSPKDNVEQTASTTTSSKFNYSEQHIKTNTSSMSGDSDKRYQSYSSTDNSLQSDLFQLQDIENQIGDL